MDLTIIYKERKGNCHLGRKKTICPQDATLLPFQLVGLSRNAYDKALQEEGVVDSFCNASKHELTA